jgi:cobalamin biosynthesis Co2+ chelatase CbiK
MKLEFEMTNLGMMIKQEKREYLYLKEHTSEKILQKLRMKDYNPIATPMELDAKLSKLEKR